MTVRSLLSLFIALVVLSCTALAQQPNTDKQLEAAIMKAEAVCKNAKCKENIAIAKDFLKKMQSACTDSMSNIDRLEKEIATRKASQLPAKELELNLDANKKISANACGNRQNTTKSGIIRTLEAIK